jgi:peptidoglycan/LPS O-acetylase OafA/YrhL
MIKDSNKIYFPNLNGIRFIAAFLVIIHHIEQNKLLLGLNNNWDFSFVQLFGPLGVVMFFVLSGFLITYLLLVEEKVTNEINIKKFYIRRIFRIWPLYYIIVLLSFFILPQIELLNVSTFTDQVYTGFTGKFLLFVFFLPNLALILFPFVPFASQTWSVGVEEQFYLIWPVLMKKIKNKKKLLYSIIFVYLFVKMVVFYCLEKYVYWNSILETLKLFMDTFNIDCMAIGGLFALYLFEKNKILDILYSKYIQIFIYVLLAILIISGKHFVYFHNEIYSVLFGVLILNLSSNSNSILSLENKIFYYLGKISYGLYMYHGIAIVLVLKALSRLQIENVFIEYILILFFTILFSGLSFKYIESYFINKKTKFSIIESGNKN